MVPERSQTDQQNAAQRNRGRFIANHGFDLSGKLAVVTGGTHGRLGPIWMKALQEAGADVVAFDLPAGDVTSENDVRMFLRSYAPNILVNNAGVDSRPSSSMSYNEMAVMMCDVNVRGTDCLCRIVGEQMRIYGGGSIINIASLYGLCSPDLRYYDHRTDGWVKDSMYGATKAGIISLTKYYAAKWAKQGVRVNALAPGGIVAPGDSLTAQDPQFVEKYTARIPMGRMCRPEDLAGPLVFLASDASSFVTGHTIPVDGGYLTW